MALDEADDRLSPWSDDPFHENPLLTYQSFQSLTEKSIGRTVKETWLRMLMSIHGIGVEKALSVARRFPTPMR